MLTKMVVRTLACAGGLALLAGCAELKNDFRRQFANRYGPDPVIPIEDATETVKRHSTIISVFRSPPVTDAQGIPLIPAGSWYDAAQAGMNYVDEKCDAYMQDLFIINRGHDRIDNVLKIMDKTGQAVLDASGASRKSITILGQAFGLTEGLNDSVLKSYLFNELPGIVADKVKAARVFYRKTIDAQGHVPDYTPEEAFKIVRNYLELCMPQTIEGKFLDTYINSKPTDKPDGDEADTNKPTKKVTIEVAPLVRKKAARPGPGAVILAPAVRDTNIDVKFR